MARKESTVPLSCYILQTGKRLNGQDPGPKGKSSPTCLHSRHDLSFNPYNPIMYKYFTIISIFHIEEKDDVLVNVSHQYTTEIVLVLCVFWS